MDENKSGQQLNLKSLCDDVKLSMFHSPLSMLKASEINERNKKISNFAILKNFIREIMSFR